MVSIQNKKNHPALKFHSYITYSLFFTSNSKFGLLPKFPVLKIAHHILLKHMNSFWYFLIYYFNNPLLNAIGNHSFISGKLM